MRSMVLICVVVAVGATAACSREIEAAATRDPSRSPAAALPHRPVRVPFSVPGVPGPWWRDDAMRADFQVDQRSCRTISIAARDSAAAENRKDVAYRAFLACMAELDWTRGHPPAEQPHA